MNFMKSAGLLLCAAMVCMTAAGCNKEKDTVKPADKDYFPAATTAVTTRATQTGSIGEPASMKDMEVTISQLYRSEFYGSQDGVLSNIVFLDVTVTNNTDEEIDANMLTSFEFHVDGAYHDSATLQAISSAKKQYGDDVEMFSEPVAPGETRTGIIAAELPDYFKEAALYFLPLGGGIGDTYDPSSAIVYTFERGDLQLLTRPAIAEDSEATETETAE